MTGLAQSPWSSGLTSGSSRSDPTGLEAGPSCSGSAGLLLTGPSFSGPLPRRDLGGPRPRSL